MPIADVTIGVPLEEVPEYPLAPAYERVHFIGTALFNLGITEKNLKEHADEIVARLQEEIGYRVFLIDIKVKHRVLWTDVDFAFDVPYEAESPIDPYTVYFFLKVLAAVLLAIAALAFIVWLFWTTWVEKLRVYYCDQHAEPLPFEGYKTYLAHLADEHPEKYEAASELAWWEKIPGMLPWILGVLILLSLIERAPRREGRR